MPASVRSAKATIAFGSTIPAARPPQVVAGDDLWAIHWCDGDDTSIDDMTAPPGWTEMDTNTTLGPKTKVWRKVASGGEPATQSFGQTPAQGGIILVAVSGASLTVPPVIAIQNSTGSASSTPDVEPAAASHLELRGAGILAVADTFTFTAPSGYTRHTQATGGDALEVSLVVASRQLNSSNSSGAKTFTRTPNTVSLISAGVSISIASADTEPTPEPPPPFTPALGSGKYQYIARRLLDRAYLGHLTGLEQVSFERRISTAGTFSGRIPITNVTIGDQIDAIIPRDPAELARGPGVITVEILREGEYWGEFWITGAVLAKDRRKPPTLELRGSSLEAYFQHVRLREDLEFTGVDQIEIGRQLLDHMQAQSSADLGLLLQGGTSGQVRDRTYKAVDRAPYGQRLAELGDVINGFEWTIDTVAGTAGLDRSWRWGAPTIGDPNAKHVFGEGAYGGDILAWRIEIDALRGGTYWEARGDSDSSDASTAGAPRISTLHAATAHVAAGWPRIDRVIDRPGVTRLQTLEDYAAGWAARKSGAVRVWSVTVAIGAQPSFSPNSLGDAARFVMSDEWHKRTGSGAGLNARHRVIGVRVTPVGRDQGKDEMDLIIESSEVT